jgi:phosphoglycolate phosphatase-like HAD superfamily hydrolase
MLILFDIDATLIKTSGLGIKAMGLAGRELFGDTFNERTVDYAGRLDPLIITDLLRHHGIPENGSNVTRFRAGYRKYLEQLLAEPGVGITCPGVPQLLERLRGRAGLTIGLLTGNFPETGRVKLRACGIDPDQFRVAAWGDESPHVVPARDHLPPVAMARHARHTGKAVDPRHVTIIGDTPHDIGCARAHGCRSLGVGTGQFTAAALRDSGADFAVDDLSDTTMVEKWLVGIP